MESQTGAVAPVFKWWQKCDLTQIFTFVKLLRGLLEFCIVNLEKACDQVPQGVQCVGGRSTVC